MAKHLLVGGAGYVGSAVASLLQDQGHEVWILDDFSTGRIELVRALGLENQLAVMKTGDRKLLREFLKSERRSGGKSPFDCVMHFAARNIVPESVREPEAYFENNVNETQRLLETMLEEGIRNFVFSSTCAIFGDPGNQVITEDLPKNPLHPYGATKLEAEKRIEALTRSKPLDAIALRYFNASGAEPKIRVGEWHEPETHLIPNLISAALNGRPLEVFGSDYPTPDGTCIRDYVHISDIAEAHLLAADRLMKKSPTRLQGSFEDFNIGSESGFSVAEILKEASEALGVPIQRVDRPRREGDVPRLLSDSSKAKRELGYAPKRSLREILISAHEWEKKKETLVRNAPGAVFLDRDGTINRDPGYLSHPDLLELLPGVGEGLALLKRAGFLLVVISNQSGVSRGLIDSNQIPRIHERLNWMLGEFGTSIDRFEICTDLPGMPSDFRKPAPGMILRAARRLGIRLDRSYVIGDRESDLQAGRAAGVAGVVLVKTGHGKEECGKMAEGAYDSAHDGILQAAQWILNQASYL